MCAVTDGTGDVRPPTTLLAERGRREQRSWTRHLAATTIRTMVTQVISGDYIENGPRAFMLGACLVLRDERLKTYMTATLPNHTEREFYIEWA